jgi:putative solute:sodium symporter small subunit
MFILTDIMLALGVWLLSSVVFGLLLAPLLAERPRLFGFDISYFIKSNRGSK